MSKKRKTNAHIPHVAVPNRRAANIAASIAMTQARPWNSRATAATPDGSPPRAKLPPDIHPDHELARFRAPFLFKHSKIRPPASHAKLVTQGPKFCAAQFDTP